MAYPFVDRYTESRVFSLSVVLWALLQTIPEPSFEERRLATLPESVLETRFALFGSDGKSVACVSKVNEGWCVFIGDKQGPVFDEVRCYYDHHLTDATQVPYFGITKEQWTLVHDGKRYGPFDPGRQNDYPYLTSDALPYFIRQQKEKRCLFLNGKQGKTWDDLKGPYPSRQHERIGFTAIERGKGHRVIIDNIEGAPFDWIYWGPHFSANGSHYGYVARKDGRWHAVVDGKVGPAFDAAETPVFSPDGDAFVYVANTGGDLDITGIKGGRSFLVDRDMRSKEFDSIKSVQYAPDGRVSFIATLDGKQRLVIGGRELEAHDEITHYLFSKDGKRLGYSAKDGGKFFVFTEGRKSGPFDGLHSLRLSPAEDGFAFIATLQGRSTVIRDGKPGPSYEEIRSVFYTPDGKRLILVLSHDKKSQIVFGDQKSEPSDEWLDSESCFISRDSTKVAFGCRIGRELWWKVLKQP